MQSKNQWDSAADWYDQNMGEEGDKLNHDIIRPLVLQMIGPLAGKNILDSGCGSGYFSAELAKSASKVVGTDFLQILLIIVKINTIIFQIFHFLNMM